MLRPAANPGIMLISHPHLERSSSCDTARPRKEGTRSLFCRRYSLEQSTHCVRQALFSKYSGSRKGKER